MNIEIYEEFISALDQAAIITTTDAKGIILSANDNFCSISGYSEEELIGQTHRLVNSGTHPKEFFRQMWKTISSGKVWRGEVCNRTKLKDLYWVHASIFPTYKNGELYQYSAIRFDITAQKEAELRLQNIATKYQSVIEVTDGFCHITTDGKFIDVSDGFCELTGYSREELMNINLFDTNENSPLNIPKSMAVFKHHEKNIEIEQTRKNGSKWIAEITISSAIIKDGTQFVFLHDITEKKHIENANKLLQAQVNQMQKLESIGRLTAGVAHDFNNILAGIMGYNEINKMIIEDIPHTSDTKDLIHNLYQIDVAVKRAANLIDKMMVYARQDTIKDVPNKQEATYKVINDASMMLSAALTSKYTIELDLDENLSIKINDIDLHQIITNLIVNSRDAMPSGKINIQLSIVKNLDADCTACHAVLKGDFIELSVADNGTGIDKKIMAKVFDPFFTTKEVGKGTGLGLSVVNGLVRSAGGHIIVESEIGLGTTFRLLFPVELRSITRVKDIHN
ncbi:MAG: PAS domain-containing sensor histidine kinase [Methylococcaceae bacterium]|nr:PAS domain-containing sensor histidine kinase [Methylococcaceae bacterium]